MRVTRSIGGNNMLFSIIAATCLVVSVSTPAELIFQEYYNTAASIDPASVPELAEITGGTNKELT